MNELNELKNYEIFPFDESKIETVAVMKAEQKARSLLAELKGFANIMPNQEILINAVVLQESKDSSEIENIVTTKDLLYKALAETVTKVDGATKEVMFYREAVYKGLALIKAHGFLSINDVVQIQKILVQNDAGIRTLPGTALVNDKTNQVVYTPPQDKETIQRLLQSLFEYLNGADDSLAKLAVIHFQFESIHPFYDGNGRTGRIINILYLIMKGHLDLPILYLSSWIIKNKDKYYELLQNVRDGGEWENWILFVLNGIEETSRETLQKIKDIKNLLDNTLENVKAALPKMYSKELVELLFENPYSKIDMLVRKLKIDRRTASNYLKKLCELGILKMEKVSKENIFINVGLMEILKN